MDRNAIRADQVVSYADGNAMSPLVVLALLILFSPAVRSTKPLPFKGNVARQIPHGLFRLDLSTEEYAARFGHQFVQFSFDKYRY